jgi:hypothetical protein
MVELMELVELIRRAKAKFDAAQATRQAALAAAALVEGGGDVVMRDRHPAGEEHGGAMEE